MNIVEFPQPSSPILFPHPYYISHIILIHEFNTSPVNILYRIFIFPYGNKKQICSHLYEVHLFNDQLTGQEKIQLSFNIFAKNNVDTFFREK